MLQKRREERREGRRNGKGVRPRGRLEKLISRKPVRRIMQGKA